MKWSWTSWCEHGRDDVPWEGLLYCDMSASPTSPVDSKKERWQQTGKRANSQRL